MSGRRDTITDGRSNAGPSTMPIRVVNPITLLSAWRDELKCGGICNAYASYAIIFHGPNGERREALACRDCLGTLIESSNRTHRVIDQSWEVLPVIVTTYTCGEGCDHTGYVKGCFEHGGPL